MLGDSGTPSVRSNNIDKCTAAKAENIEISREAAFSLISEIFDSLYILRQKLKISVKQIINR